MGLLFVYNADGGRWNAALDTLHKVVSPRTYECRLCELTHGVVGVREAWTRALDELGVEAAVLHRNEFRARFGRDDELPAVFEVDESAFEEGAPPNATTSLRPLLTAEQIGELRSLDDLIDHLAKAVGREFHEREE